MKKVSALLLLVILGFSLTTAAQKTVGWSLGYYVSWDHSYTPTTLPWNAFTHVSNFQVTINNDGSLGLPDETIAKELISVGHSKGKKVIFSIGGGGYGQQFATATNASHRNKFISDLISYMKRLGYDGIDTDWEGNEVVSQFVAFHKELRDSLNKITPTPCLAIAAEDWNPLAGQVHMYVDMINDMWYGATASNYPGYLQTFVGMGAPKSKCAPGIGISPDNGSANMGVQATVDLCNMVVNQGWGGIMLWCIQTKGNVPSDLAAVVPYIPLTTDNIAEHPGLFETPVALSLQLVRASKTSEIRYTVPCDFDRGTLDLGIFNMRGALVKTLVHGHANPGVFTVPFSQACAPGTYIVKLSSNNSLLTSKAIIAK